ncbi:MAG: acetylglucosamine-6-sulfatase [Blastopirellula sp.]|nr:MAG: acetylglucosamine-6-sulfatase [Blastopirellula sp.]
MNRFILPLCLLLISITVNNPALSDDRPNIIFLLTDDQRADSLACMGNSIVETPNIDQLAKDGVLFENAFVTSAICTPSRACYFLGQYERRHGINFNSGTTMAKKAWQKSYPVLLKKAGYFTGYVGKNHVPIGTQGYKTGLIDNSFDFFYAGHGHLYFYPKIKHKIFDAAKSDTQIEIIAEGAASFLNPNSKFIDGAITFLKSRPKDQPFCLSYCFNLPHNAGTSTMKMRPTDPILYRTKYRDKLAEIPLPSTYVAKDDIKTPKLPADVLYTQYRQPSYAYVDTPELLRERYVREYQTITGIDRLVGELRQQLAEHGVADNTIIIYASDHGIMHGEFGLGGKSLNYDTCLKIPMIIMDPRQNRTERGTRLTDLVLSVDIAPTILDFAGVKRPNTMQGSSLTDVLSGNNTGWREYAFAENLWSTIFGVPRCESARSKDWKYIRYFATDRKAFENVEGDARYKVSPKHAAMYRNWLNSSLEGEKPDYEELFYITDDPEESNNLASDPNHQEKLKEMRTELQRLLTEAKGDVHADPLTTPLVILKKPL